MSYAAITRDDRNAIKRFLQRRRLNDAVGLAALHSRPRVIVDFGAGDGELSRRLAAVLPAATIFCYEPAEDLWRQAASVVRGQENVVLTSSVESLPDGQADLVFCLEVFEHLPPAETASALADIDRLLAEDGLAAIGVPVEVFAPALAKGLLRMWRRPGAFDARPGNVLAAALGAPPGDRPTRQIAPGLSYYPHHTGFDFRRLRRQLAERFDIEGEVCSPVPWLGAWFNSEIVFLAQKRMPAASPHARRSRAHVLSGSRSRQTSVT
jgi:SAM-dependent methyltransferase